MLQRDNVFCRWLYPLVPSHHNSTPFSLTTGILLFQDFNINMRPSMPRWKRNLAKGVVSERIISPLYGPAEQQPDGPSRRYQEAMMEIFE
jgi:hypothetical protein